MLYDKTPQYAHYADLPYASEPLKSLYVLQRLFTTLLLVPFWALKYLLLPRSYRPRPSWNIRQIIFVNFTRRIFKVTEVAGVTWGTKNPGWEPKEGELKETRFVWVEPLREELRTGIVNDERVPFMKVGCYVWPKSLPRFTTTSPSTITKEEAKSIHSNSNSDKSSKTAVQVEDVPMDHHSGRTVVDTHTDRDKDVDIESAAAEVPIIGIYMHGGGYTHMSAYEKSRTSRIPRGLVKGKMMHEIYSVEYRLLQFAPFPAVVQDAAAVYSYVVDKYHHRREKCKIVLVGDSSGGNLVLALARWIRDEGKLPMPDGLLLLSPSCDTSHAIPSTQSSYVPRPNASTDYLVDTIEPRALLQTTFLGFRYYPPSHHHHLNQGEREKEEERKLMEVVHSEYVSVASPKVLRRWGHEVTQHDELEKHELERTQTLVREGEVRLPPTIPTDIDSPYHKSSRFPKLFSQFPRTFIMIGDAERLTREVASLSRAMEKDEVDVKTMWVKDAVHDMLIIAEGWWDEKVRKEVWKEIGEWMSGF